MDSTAHNNASMPQREMLGRTQWNPNEGMDKSPMPSANGGTQQLMVIRESGAVQLSADSTDKLLDASLGLLGAFFVVVLVERRLRRWLHE